LITASLRAIPGSIAVAGAVVLAVSVLWARYDELHPFEMRVFGVVNRMPDWLYVPLWLPMQYGNFMVGLLAGVAVGLALGEPATAVAVVLAAFAKLAVERGIRQWMSSFGEVRQRPGTSEPGAITRGKDVPTKGASFHSGHVLLAAAISTVLSSSLTPGWALVPWVLTLLVMVGRVYVGAHNPLDVTAGLGAGMIIGGGLDILLR
jgi:undecaprenyl-diphosphatase